MHVAMEEKPLDMEHLPSFLRTQPPRGFDAGRAIGLGFTIALHVIVVAVIVFAGIKVRQAVAPPPIMVSVAEDKPTKPPEPPRPLPLVRPRLDMAPMPEIDIAPETPTQSIHIPVAPPPAAPAEPVPSVAPAETQQSYLAQLLGYLNRYKHYPPAARAARIQGVVMLHFVMDKTGHVTTFDISRSSGKPALDEEALALIQRAQPLPPIPADFGKDTINAVVPIEFSLH
ncbi:MAG: energy transducer TonB [Rhizomicrobium sp.]